MWNVRSILPSSSFSLGAFPPEASLRLAALSFALLYMVLLYIVCQIIDMSIVDISRTAPVYHESTAPVCKEQPSMQKKKGYPKSLLCGSRDTPSHLNCRFC